MRDAELCLGWEGTFELLYAVEQSAFSPDSQAGQMLRARGEIPFRARLQPLPGTACCFGSCPSVVWPNSQ